LESETLGKSGESEAKEEWPVIGCSGIIGLQKFLQISNVKSMYKALTKINKLKML